MSDINTTTWSVITMRRKPHMVWVFKYLHKNYRFLCCIKKDVYRYLIYWLEVLPTVSKKMCVGLSPARKQAIIGFPTIQGKTRMSTKSWWFEVVGEVAYQQRCLWLIWHQEFSLDFIKPHQTAKMAILNPTKTSNLDEC